MIEINNQSLRELRFIMKILELFGGIGTPRKALENKQIDVKSIDYVEKLSYAVRAYNAMYNNGYKPQDIKTWNMNVDLLVHGSPCQDFSKNGLNNINTGRSILFERTLEIIEFELNRKPKYVIWENVPNLLSKLHRHHYDYYVKTMKRLGYNTFTKIINATDYGSGQKRPRMYAVSVLDGTYEFPQPVNENKRKHVKEYLDMNTSFDDYPLSENEKTLFFYKGDQLCVKQPTKKGYEEVYEYDTINVEFPNSKTRRGRVGHGVCPTITTHPRIAIYYHGKLRMLTTLEHVRLMGFDDSDYYAMRKTGLTDVHISALAGNAICVPVLEHLFDPIIADLEMRKK